MNFPHLATRIFNTPLMIREEKLDAILAALGERLNLADPPQPNAAREKTNLDRKPYHVTSDGIAVISVFGPLVKRDSGDFLSGGPTTYGELDSEFMDAATDPDVKGIVFDIDSPGGEVGGLFEFAKSIYSQRGSKPIYSVANDDAFSAAYMIASAAEKVYVTQTGGVGSVGVYVVHVDQSELDKGMGIKFTYIFAGKKKVDLNLHKPIKDSARAEMQAEIDRLYGIFVDGVAQNRSADAKAIRETEAGLLFGDAGIPLLADKQGGLADALADMGKALGGSTQAKAMAASMGVEAKDVEADIEAADYSAEAQSPEDSEKQVPEAAAESAPQTEEGESDMSEENKTVADTKEKPQVDVSAVIEKAKAEGKAEGQATTKIITELCQIAGANTEQLTEFLTENLTVDQVRAKLIDLRAEKTAADVSSHVDALAGNGKAPLEAAVEKIQDQKDCTKEMATLIALERNPKLYDTYAAEHPRQFAPVEG